MADCSHRTLGSSLPSHHKCTRYRVREVLDGLPLLPTLGLAEVYPLPYRAVGPPDHVRWQQSACVGGVGRPQADMSMVSVTELAAHRGLPSVHLSARCISFDIGLIPLPVRMIARRPFVAHARYPR